MGRSERPVFVLFRKTYSLSLYKILIAERLRVIARESAPRIAFSVSRGKVEFPFGNFVVPLATIPALANSTDHC